MNHITDCPTLEPSTSEGIIKSNKLQIHLLRPEVCRLLTISGGTPKYSRMTCSTSRMSSNKDIVRVFLCSNKVPLLTDVRTNPEWFSRYHISVR